MLTVCMFHMCEINMLQCEINKFVVVGRRYLTYSFSSFISFFFFFTFSRIFYMTEQNYKNLFHQNAVTVL